MNKFTDLKGECTWVLREIFEYALIRDLVARLDGSDGFLVFFFRALSADLRLALSMNLFCQWC